MVELTLPWVEKFKELIEKRNQDGLYDTDEVVQEFLVYCEQEVKKLNKRWENEIAKNGCRRK